MTNRLFTKSFFVLFFIIFSTLLCNAQSIITTIAGNGITQYIGDGYPATNFSLAQPYGLCEDKSGNIFVADFADHRIRRINNQDTLFTFCGIGTSGYSGDGGLIDTATIRNPSGVCIDTAGNLYITEWYNNVLRKVDKTTHIVTTVCGTSAYGFSGDNGPATNAHLANPYASCIDNEGNIYIPDAGNNRIRKVNMLTGTITTVAGTGVMGYSGDNIQATNAKLANPMGVCLDSLGNIYIADNGNHRIRKVDALTGIITTIAGNGVQGYFGDGGLAINSQIAQPNAIAADRFGNIYFSDFGNNVIRTIYTNGAIKTIAGNGHFGFSGDNGPATNATFNGATGIFVNDSGFIYIADGGNSAIRKVTPLNLGIKVENTNENSIQIYPNPTHGTITFNISNMSELQFCDVVNPIGQIIYSAKIATGNIVINLSAYSSGIYFIHLYGQKEYMHKIVLLK